MKWYDYFRLFTFGFQRDPYSKSQDPKNLTGSGISQPDALQTMGGDDIAAGSQGLMAYRQSNDMIDVTTLTNRTGRYKEYERLRNIAEIETVMTVVSDEACVSGDTKIATPFGFRTIKDLVDEGSNEKFLVYCFDEINKDHTLGWAYAPRFVKKEKTLTIILEDGSKYTATSDHKVLMKNGSWEETGKLKIGDELIAFYRLPVNPDATKIKQNQFPRIFTYNHGWTHERFFVDKWRFGKLEEKNKSLHKALHMLSKGIMVKKVAETIGITTVALQQKIEKAGFTAKELKKLARKPDYRRVIGIVYNEPEDVYDISVEEHKCFCTDSVVLHNCQKDDNGNICKFIIKNDDIKNELEFLFFNRNMINLNKNGWNWFKNLCVNGDHFLEVIINPENPEEGIYKTAPLPAETMYRIETTKGKLIEFQQSKEGPDYSSLTNPIDLTNNKDVEKSTAIRFSPYQIIHFRIGEDRKTFYPYGVSLIEPARSPAHQLRLMEDSMVVYRLARATERRVFYIDVGQLPPHKVDSLMDRMKDQFRKRKVAGGYGEGADKIDERWHAPAVDEDFWLPLRPGSNTRIETLPGACLSLETKIALLDGRNLELKEIIKEYKEGKKLWVYSIDPKTGESVPGPITWAGVTRKDAKVVKITLDNGKNIICTPDHKFPVQGREGKVEAKDLKSGDSLWGFNRRHKKLRSNTNEYEQVYDNKSKEWVFTHRLVANYEINSDEELFNMFVENNKHVKRKTFKPTDGVKKTHVERMVKFYGYKNLDHAKEECGFYNHKVLKVEFLEETMDTGTITVDINETYTKHHTFALSDCGVYTYNSALGEIDDAVYFRNKLFVSLNFPKNYFSGEDINITKVSLSSQDVKFARMIERLQSAFEDGLYEIADRHLTLRGYPQELYKDLKIKMTPPSDWRELSRLDVVNARLSVATQLKSSVLMADYDIYLNWLKYTPEETEEMLGRLKVQKLEELRSQVVAQNPQLLGIGVPGSEDESENQIGTEPGGPSMNLESPAEQMPAEQAPETTDQSNEQPSEQPEGETQELAEPEKEDIEKYGLEIQDYEYEMDEENPDYSIEG
jgi:intein/homing endonuclease